MKLWQRKKIINELENVRYHLVGGKHKDVIDEAIEEFAEKLNSGFLRDHIYNGSYVLGLIEAIAKGMAGDSNA